MLLDVGGASASGAIGVRAGNVIAVADVEGEKSGVLGNENTTAD